MQGYLGRAAVTPGVVLIFVLGHVALGSLHCSFGLGLFFGVAGFLGLFSFCLGYFVFEFRIFRTNKGTQDQ